MKITGAIFDMDGTLLDSMDYWAIVAGEYLKSKGVTPFDDDNRHFLEDGLSAWYKRAVESHGLKDSLEEATAAIYDFMANYYQTVVKVKDGARELLEKLKNKGVKICLATATDKKYVIKILEKLGIYHYFSGIFTTREVGVGKRSPKIYHVATEFLGTDPKTTYVFEDAHYAIKTCHDNGINVVGIYDKNVFVPKEEIKSLCNYYIDENDKYSLDIE